MFLHTFFTDKGKERCLLVRQSPYCLWPISLVALETVIHGAKGRSARSSTAITICHESEYTRFISTYCSQSTVFVHFV